MSETTRDATAWIYRGVWSILVEWFRVPKDPPVLPVERAADVEAFRPAAGFLRYLKFWFWLALLPVDVAIAVGWIVLLVLIPWLGVVLTPVAFILAVVPDIVVYVALHLRYDTTWYVMSRRSLRIRRGVWVIHEVTITFENVQNVKVQQGPLQRYYGIANVVVETAGAGSQAHQKGFQVTNQGLLEGIADPARIRETIMMRLRESRTAGLGDEVDHGRHESPGWSPEHIQVLREIRDEVAALAV